MHRSTCHAQQQTIIRRNKLPMFMITQSYSPGGAHM